MLDVECERLCIYLLFTGSFPDLATLVSLGPGVRGTTLVVYLRRSGTSRPILILPATHHQPTSSRCQPFVRAIDGVMGDESNGKDQSPRRTYGTTSDGTRFVVPYTRDMVSSLFDLREPKSMIDIAIIIWLGLQLALFFVIRHRVAFFLLEFTFWRLMYNVGIGWLLQQQSFHRRLVRWAFKWRLFSRDANNVRYDLIQRELRVHLGQDYDVAKMPVEYNTWLVFRKFVDLVLMSDFICYILLAFACARVPNHSAVMHILRWVAGIALFLFNLWVKLDAHRVVKDFAWYWGDFFFLVDQDLTFDGVFEMAPHPMYSVGYAGYYGISMMAASYTMLFSSLAAHALQFAFLMFVENPHIEKTYSSPKSEKRTLANEDVKERTNMSENNDLILLHNFDIFRIADFSLLVLILYTAFFTTFTPSSPLCVSIIVAHALLWRLFHSGFLGFMLAGESQNKLWTRRYLKFGQSQRDAWKQWKSFYNISFCMCQVSFAAACYKTYSLPSEWTYRMVMLRHTVGCLLIVLQIWTSISIYESLGQYGWFYGDFFLEKEEKLTYSGIYRYLNNPERLLGCTGLWGSALITSSKAIFALAAISQGLQLLVFQFVERPHMQKLYGKQIRQDAGVTKNFKRAIPKEVLGSVDRMFADSVEIVEDFLEQATPKLHAGVQSVVKDTRVFLGQYPARLTITRVSDDLANYDQSAYKLNLGKGKGSDTVSYQYGEHIHVKWNAPANHSVKDWIGIYRVADNESREVTKISSRGRWSAVDKDGYGMHGTGVLIAEREGGEIIFRDTMLFWTKGVFEFRYHHDGKHNVMAISRPFEITADRCYANDTASIREVLMRLVQACLNFDKQLIPNTYDELLLPSHRREEFAKRIVYGIRTIFGVDFAWEVVKVDGNVNRLAWRIGSVKSVLAPYVVTPSTAETPPNNHTP